MTLIPIRICTVSLPFPLEDFTGRVKINSTFYPCGVWKSNFCPSPLGPLWGATCEIPDDRAIAYGQVSNEYGDSPLSVDPFFVPEPGVTSSLLVGTLLLLFLRRVRRKPLT